MFQREQQSKPRERSFYGHMRNNQILPNTQLSSNNTSTLDNYLQRHLSTATTGVEHLTDTVGTRVTKVIEPIIIMIMADTRIDHTVIIDHTATIDLIVSIDHKTDITTITEADRRAITETIITETIQITETVVTATTEIPTVPIQIIVITKDIIHDHHTNIHDHHINPDYHTKEIETQITITEVDTTATIDIEDQIIKTIDKVVITETEININHTIDKTEIDPIILKTNHRKMNKIYLELKSAINQQILRMKISRYWKNSITPKKTLATR